MGLINHIKDIFDDDKHLEENPIFSLLIFTPASVISSIISIPFALLGIIFFSTWNNCSKVYYKNFTFCSTWSIHGALILS